MNNKKKIALITGGMGFIGKNLVLRLIDEGYVIRILSRTAHNSNNGFENVNEDIEYYTGNVAVLDDLDIPGQDVDVIYHLAAAMSGDWNEHLQTTVQGTHNILSICDKYQINNLIYLSTINVYKAVNYNDLEVINELFEYEDHPELRGNYSNSKLIAEKLVCEYGRTVTHPMNISIIRPGLVYGYKSHGLLLDIGPVIKNKLILSFSPKKKRLPIVYIDNLIDALILAGDKVDNQHYIFNVVDNDYPTQSDFIKLFNTYSDCTLYALFIPYYFLFFLFYVIDLIINIIPGKSSSYSYKIKSIKSSPAFSTDSIQRELGWKQQIDFSAAIKASIKK